MRQLFFALAFGLTACATPQAAADLPETDYGERVAACVAAADGDEAALNACQGAASHPCMDAPGGETTIGMVMCLNAEGEAWGTLLDATQTRLASNPDTVGALTSAQQQWREYRDAECGYSVARWGLGSGAQVAYASCMAKLTADRAIALIRIEKLGD